MPAHSCVSEFLAWSEARGMLQEGVVVDSMYAGADMESVECCTVDHSRSGAMASQGQASTTSP